MRISSIARKHGQNTRETCCQRTLAFTIVELMVSMAIIGLLVAVTVPAVQQSREAVRRAQCASQLKQLGLAIHNYESTWRTFPLHDWDTSFLVHILPELELGSMLQGVDPYDRRPGMRAGIGALASITVPLFQCPSDSSDVRGGTNYVGNFGWGYQVFNESNGVIVNHIRPLRFSEVTDGLSQTALLSECVMGNHPNSHRLSKVWRTPYRLGGASQLDQFMTLCRQTSNQNSPSEYRGRFWTSSFSDTIYTHTLYPNDVSCVNAGDPSIGIYSASSLHPGGVQLLLCDGHLRFVSTQIDLKLWRAIGTRNGGESLSEF